MRWNYLILLLLFTAPSVVSQEYSLIGETGPGGMISDEDTALNLRTYFDHRLNYEKSSFGASHSIIYSPVNPDELTFNLYSGYADFRISDQLLLTAGKFRVPWTKGIYFTALDKLNPESTELDTDSPKHGFWGGAITWTPSMNTTLLFCGDISSDAENGSTYDSGKAAGYISMFFGNLDLFISGIYQHDGIGLGGIGLSYNFFDFVLYTEAGLIFENNYLYPDNGGFSSTHRDYYLMKNTPLTASAGTQRQFYIGDTTLSMTMEYLFTEYGYSSQQTEQYFYLVYSGIEADGDIPEFGRHYFVCSAGINVTDLFSIDNSVLVNATDGSTVQSHSFTLLTLPGTDVSGGITLFYGDDTTEIGASPYTYLFDWMITYHF